MGGESGGASGAPYDLMGGQLASFSGGTPGFNWPGFGKSLGSGLESAGNSLGNYQTPGISSSTGGGTQTQPYGANPLPFTMIPESQGGGDIVALLQRLLGGG